MVEYHISNTAAAALCPLCAQANACAIAAGGDAASCWCMTTEIKRSAVAEATARDETARCICAKCGAAIEGDLKQ